MAKHLLLILFTLLLTVNPASALLSDYCNYPSPGDTFNEVPSRYAVQGNDWNKAQCILDGLVAGGGGGGTDTTCNDAGVTCLFAGSASEGGPATTATALATNGANCSAGSYPLGVNASGAVESCTAAPIMSTDDFRDVGGTTQLKACSDGQVLTFNASSNYYVCSTLGAGTGDVVGPASSTNSDLACFDGATGKLLKDCGTNVPTATALATNGGNCSAGSYPLGVDASGAVESCTAVGSGSGDVVGPASATDNAIARYDTTTGKLIQNSVIPISDAGDISNIESLVFDTATAATPTAGNMYWDDTAGTLVITLKGGNILLPIGQESNILVKNADAAGLIKGQAVYTVGSDGVNTTVRYAKADTGATAHTIMGVVSEAASGGAKAFVTVYGLISDIDTSHLTEGAEVWVSPTTAGLLTSTRPTSPNHSVRVGYCIRSHAVNGVLFISMDRGNEMEELDDLELTSVASNDFILYDSTDGRWENRTSAAAKTALAIVFSDVGGSVTDAQVPDTITVNTATNADNLTTDPGDCGANTFATSIDRQADLSCTAIADADVPDTITVTLAATATALAANGGNCTAGSYPLGVDASGAVESCTTANLGDVVGPASSTNSDIACFDGATGKLLKDCGTNVPTATALAANGGNCSSGTFPLGVDTLGAVESCGSTLASTSTNADTTMWPLLTGTSDPDVPRYDPGYTFNGSTDTLTTSIFSGALSGNATTASALAANGTNCSGNEFALGVSASGVGECAQPAFSNLSGEATDAQIPDTITASNYQLADPDLTTWAGVTPGTGVASALGVNVGTAGAIVVNGGALGTPSSGVATNLTGTATALNIGGNAATATSAGTATNADNLTNDPGPCGANQFVTDVDRQVDLTCAALTDSDVPNSLTLASTSTNADTTMWPMLTGTTDPDVPRFDPGFTFNGSTDTLTTSIFSGALSGNATTATALVAEPAACTGTDKYSDLSASGTSTCTADDDVPDSGDFGNLTGGAGITVSAGTVATASEETGFIAAGASALTCGAGTAGQVRVIPTGGFTYCDNNATPTLRYSTFGNGFGGANSVNVTDSGADITTWCNFSAAAATGTQGVVTDPGCIYNASTNAHSVLRRYAGTGTGYGGTTITLYNDSDPAVGNVGAGTDDLKSYQLPANSVVAEGDWVRVTAHVRFAGNANNKKFELLWGATQLYTSGTVAYNAASLVVTTTISYGPLGSATAMSHAACNSSLFPVSATVNFATPATPAFTSDVTIKGTGVGVANDDVLQTMMLVEYGTAN